MHWMYHPLQCTGCTDAHDNFVPFFAIKQCDDLFAYALLRVCPVDAKDESLEAESWRTSTT